MDIGAIITAAGVVLGGGGLVALVRVAVGAADRRADDWRLIAQDERAARTITDQHVERLVGAVEQLTAAQRESLGILKTLAAQAERGREAA